MTAPDPPRPDASRSPAWGLACTATVLGLALTGVLLEAGARLLFPPESIAFADAQPAPGDGPALVVETLTGARLRPNAAAKVVFNDGKEVVIRSNERGFRGGPLGPKQPGELRILVVGDSVTLGEFVAEQDTFCAQLENLLKPSVPGARVLNAGVTGLDLFSEVNLLAETGLAAEPDLVILASYLNDWISVEHLRPLRGVLRHSAFAVKLHESLERNRIVANLARYRDTLASTKPAPVPWTMDGPWLTDRALFEPIRLSGLFDWGYAWEPDAWERIRPEYVRARELAAEHRVPLAVVLFPVMFQVRATWNDPAPQRLFGGLMRSLGMAHHDVLPALREQARTEPGLYYDHCHLTEAGHAAAAHAMLPFVHGLLAAARPGHGSTSAP